MNPIIKALFYVEVKDGPQFEIGKTATERADHYRTRFDAHLRAFAEIEAGRRGSTTLTEADFDAAYRHLLASQSHDGLAAAAGAVLTVIGGIVMGVGINLATNDLTARREPAFWSHYFWIVGIGALVGFAGIAVQYYRHIFR